MAREPVGLKLEDFGPFVIFTALYAAGTLGLPKFSLLAYQVKVGEMPSAFVAIFGYPAILGLTLGQFIANLGVEASPIAMISPVVSFVGLLVIYRLRKTSTFAGCIGYVVITSLWLTYLLPITTGVSMNYAAISAFLGQFIAVMIGYVGYLIANRFRSTQKPAQVE
jgi:uncharacterized membrane protein